MVNQSSIMDIPLFPYNDGDNNKYQTVDIHILQPCIPCCHYLDTHGNITDLKLQSKIVTSDIRPVGKIIDLCILLREAPPKMGEA